jgi:hypothetical protein
MIRLDMLCKLLDTPDILSMLLNPKLEGAAGPMKLIWFFNLGMVDG